MPLSVVVALSGLVGLVVGSFLNVVIYRWPRQESLLRPGSHCPVCQAPVRARHNVPVLGWLVLRGRCADCAAPIGVRYPLVELVTGLAFAGLSWRLGSLDKSQAIPAYFFVAGVGIAVAGIDLDIRRLPHRLVVPAYPVLFVLLCGAALVDGDWNAVVRSVLGGAVLAGCYAVIRLVSPEGMGGGDVTLAGFLGVSLAYLSWWTLLVGGFGAFVLGAVVGVTLMALGRATRKSAVPFGPFMVAAAIAAVVVVGGGPA